jgi:hypothetical protein
MVEAEVIVEAVPGVAVVTVAEAPEVAEVAAEDGDRQYFMPD